MNTKKLIIAFISLSIAALIVSAFAVFAAARAQYAALVASATEANAPLEESLQKTPVATKVEHTSTSAPETESLPDESTEKTEDTDATESIEEVTEGSHLSVPEESDIPSAFILRIETDRLTIIAPEGIKIYERIIDTSSLHPKDLENLLIGIEFSDESEAMCAVYDIIS